jgi:CBS domain-containing protein
MAKRVKDVMTAHPEVVSPDTTLKEAAARMETLNIGTLLVGEGDGLAGIVTDRDITIRAVALGKDPNATTVREVMSADLAYVYDDQDVDEVARTMAQRQLKRLPVFSRDGNRLVGIVALADLAVHAGRPEKAEEALEGISQPAQPERP